MASELRLTLFSIFLVLLIIFSAFFSGFESAINSLNLYQFESYYKKHHKTWSYKIVHMFIHNIQMTLSAVLIGNTVVNIGATTLSTIFFTDVARLLGANDVEAWGAGLATGVMTLLTLICGEFIPKIIARRNNIMYVRKTCWLMYLFYQLFWPIGWVLNKIFKQKKFRTATENELSTLIELIQNEGVLESSEASLVKNSIKFDETRITQIMTKIHKIVSIQVDWSIEKIAHIFTSNPHSRLPIIKDGKYIGFITFKDFFGAYYHKKDFKIEKLIKPLVTVSQYNTLDDVLQEMQIQQCHLAIVKKNIQSTTILGIITLEDLIEELVGEIYDESDHTKAITIINDFTWRVNGDVNAFAFLNKNFDMIDVNPDITIHDWIKHKFKIDRYRENSKYEDKHMVVTIKKNYNKNHLVFIVEKKYIY